MDFEEIAPTALHNMKWFGRYLSHFIDKIQSSRKTTSLTAQAAQFVFENGVAPKNPQDEGAQFRRILPTLPMGKEAFKRFNFTDDPFGRAIIRQVTRIDKPLQNPARAEGLYLDALETRDPEIHANLGELYVSGVLENNFHKGIPHLLRAALAGNLRADRIIAELVHKRMTMPAHSPVKTKINKKTMAALK